MWEVGKNPYFYPNFQSYPLSKGYSLIFVFQSECAIFPQTLFLDVL